MIDISLVIPYYNKPYEIGLILMALSKQDYPLENFEVVIIDDGSDEPLTELVKKYGDRLHITYERKERLGVRGLIRNLGVAVAQGERVIFLDSDMVPERDFISQFAAALGENQQRVVLGWRYNLFEFNKEFVDESVIEHSFEILSSQVGLPDGRIIAVEHQQRTGRSTLGNWRQLHSHSFALYKSLFLSVDGFDEEFSRNWGAEDVELGYRLEKVGAEIIFNTKAVSYHIEHPVDTNSQISSLNENYAIFLKKHPHWDVELFSKEYETLFPEQESVVTHIKEGVFQLDPTLLPTEFPEYLPDNTLLVGMESKELLALNEVTCSFYPESKLRSDKSMNLIGFNVPYDDHSFALALVSANYASVNYGLFQLLLQEMKRIAKQVIVCDENNQAEMVAALKSGEDLCPESKKEILFALDNQLHHTYLTYSYRSLALACQRRGMEVGFQLMSDPWADIDINAGFLRAGGEGLDESLQAMRQHELRFLGDRIPAVVDTFASEFFGHARNARILWEESFAKNFAKKMAIDIKHGYKMALAKREDDRQVLADHVPTFSLPAGIDSARLRNIAPRVSDDTPFTFLWTDRFTNKESSVFTLVDVFEELYGDNPQVQLQLVISDNYFPVNEIDETFQSPSLFYHVSELMIRKKSVCDSNLIALKKRIKGVGNCTLIEGVFDIEEYTTYIAEADAFVHLNAKREICPLVLEAVALQKSVITPADGRYEGYIPEDALYGVATEGVPMLFMEDAPDAFFDTRYYSYDVITREALSKALIAVLNERKSTKVPKEVAEELLQTYDWNRIAEQLESYLNHPVLNGETLC